MSKVEIIVKVEDAYENKLSEIARECKAAGMNISQQMSAVGMISGTTERANISRIERIKGVAYVEESKEISI